MTVTTVDYLKAIKQHLHTAKQNDATGILHKPSPAQLRNYCLLLFDNKLTHDDETVFRHFFHIKKEEDLRMAIQHCDVDRLKAIQKFFDGTIETPNSINLEFIAVLIKFDPRPYNHFSKKGTPLKSNPKKEDEKKNEEKPNEVIVKNKLLKKAIIIPILLAVCSIAISIKSLCFPAKECMQWNVNHYEQVACDCDKSSNPNEVKVIDEEINLKKITPNKSTIFFKNGKPLVWYCKIKGHLECYSSHGYHPLTGKPLKPITQYMIHKYLKFE
ncbi:hypothetical protein OX284_007150 [Flavobacterium sp. SUN046]|uniref:hypothetical protein n=1 Tax=Flavobacterium sp. SUN046 TaxID=3002440 RepID=UPI002DBF9A95|nr:hypothetical protein [Flavobacterium sp. SUN046]MEC4049201.1 hypothetical protein [Flavobacterium sp. SUN046]